MPQFRVWMLRFRVSVASGLLQKLRLIRRHNRYLGISGKTN